MIDIKDVPYIPVKDEGMGIERDSWLLLLRCELEALISEREAMIAENTQRSHLGYSMAYGDDAFTVLQAKMEMVGAKVLKLLTGKEA